jgi:hypothetical protein
MPSARVKSLEHAAGFAYHAFYFSHADTPPWDEHVPEWWALKLYVPSAHFAVARRALGVT